MESPHLYDNAEYNKKIQGLKVKGNMYQNEVQGGEYPDINCELANQEISLDLQNFIEDNGLIQELQSLNVDKHQLPPNGYPPRGMGPIPPSVAGNHPGIYNPLAYMPQPVHSGSQFERQFQERLPIKEEPHESPHESSPEYVHPCARVNYNSYGSSTMPSNYPMTPTTVPGLDMMQSPLCSPDSMKGKKIHGEKGGSNDDYRRRRERNNIAVRKSREKAKARSRETEERVKLLSDDNKKLQEKVKILLEKVSLYHSVFSSMNLQCLPEPFRSELRNQMEVINNQHQHQQILGI